MVFCEIVTKIDRLVWPGFDKYFYHDAKVAQLNKPVWCY